MTHDLSFLIGFIGSIGFYRLFFSLNRPAVKWRSITLLLICILECPLYRIWKHYLKGYSFLPKNIAVFIMIYVLLFLLAVVLLGDNRKRALVSASFFYAIYTFLDYPIIFIAGAIAQSPLSFLSFSIEKFQTPVNYYLFFFIYDLLRMCCCFLAAHWLRKNKGEPPRNFEIYFSLFYVSFAAILVFWARDIVEIPVSYLAASLLTTLIVAMYLIVFYIFTRLLSKKKEVSGMEPLWTADNGLSPKFSERYSLTDRDKDIVDAMMKGKNNKEIAEAVLISLRTVEKYLQNVYQKTGVSNRFAMYSMIKGE
jgi:DNA-binding CsgD family transcriptional regulator